MSAEPGVLALAWSRYQQELQRRPLRTKALTAGALAGISDVLAQRIQSRAPLNWRRSLSVLLYGFVWSGPAGHYWQNFIHRLFKGKSDPNSVAAKQVQQVVIDNVFFSPLMNVLFMTYMSFVVQGHTLKDCKTQLQTGFPSVQAQAWKVWPLVSFINYTYVPLRLRVLVINIVALFWSTFLNVRSRSLAIQAKKS